MSVNDNNIDLWTAQNLITNNLINLLVNTYFDDHGLDHLKTLQSN